MLYTVIFKKKIIVEADNAYEAEQLALEDNSIIEEEEIFKTRPTTNSERIYFGLYQEI